MRSMSEIPFALGYKMPAEWQKHHSTWISWPKNPLTFPAGVIEDVEDIFVKIIQTLSKGEKVNILVDDEKMEKKVLPMLNIRKNIFFYHIRTADVWTRDYGPVFVKNKSNIAAVKWIFNAWGDKWDDLKPDNTSGMKIAKSTGFRIFQPGIVLEGGSIDNNGFGTCLTTEQCLLNRNRNPHLNRTQIEKILRDYLGFTNIIWLKEGIVGDDTDGHIDDIARFVNKNTIVCAMERNKNDENYEILKTNFELLKKAKDQDGSEFDVIELPMPRKIEIPERRLPASYANFYIGNSAVLVPTFNDKNDEKAMSIIGEFFPDREIIGIQSEALIYGYGGIHCATQQQPI